MERTPGSDRFPRPAARPTGERLADCLRRQGVRLDDVLARRIAAMPAAECLAMVAGRCALAPERLWRAYADTFGLGFIDLDLISIDDRLAGALGLDFCRRRRCLPLRRVEGLVELAVSDPTDLGLALEVQHELHLEVVRLLAQPEQLDRYLTIVSVNRGMVDESLAAIDADALRDEARALGPGRARDQLAAFMERLVLWSAGRRASDLHIEALEDSYRVRARIDGTLVEQAVLARAVGAAAVNWGKVAAGMDLAERRLPQDGRLTIATGSGRIDLRASTIPTVHGEKLALRLMDQRRVMLDLEAMSFAARLRGRWESMLVQPHGLILVTGPTGSGKTTTLYASLGRIAVPGVNVTTVEDPVEFHLGSINQVQVQPKIGLTFARVLRACLRQDPDVILVGEIRDGETAEVAVQAALTGHLVLGTLHTNTAADAVVRLADLGIPPYHVAQVLRGVLSQRLVRRLCTCREPAIPDPVLLQAVGLDSGGGGGIATFRPVGCDSCHGEGYLGRLPVHELLAIEEPVARRIARSEPVAAWLEEARALGWRPLVHDGLVKAAAGLTSLAEIAAISSPSHESASA